MPLFFTPYPSYLPDRTRSVVQTGFERLSVGFRSPPGSVERGSTPLSEEVRSRIRDFLAAERDAESALGTALRQHTACNEVAQVIGRMRELAVQAAESATSPAERDSLDAEIRDLKQEVERLAKAHTFDGVGLLASERTTVAVRLDAVLAGLKRIELGVGGLPLADLGRLSLAGPSAQHARLALGTLDDTMGVVAGQQAVTGAMVGRLHAAIATVRTGRTNLEATASDARELDAAAERSVLGRAQSLLEDGVATLALGARREPPEPHLLN